MVKQQYPCSNNEIHMQFEHGFWLKSVNIIGHCHMMIDTEEAPQFSMSFYVVMLFSRDFK